MPSIDLGQLASDVSGALIGALDDDVSDIAAFAKGEAAKIAVSVAEIGELRAAGVIGEAMLAIVLADSFREKFGGDSIEEMKRNFVSYSEALRQY